MSLELARSLARRVLGRSGLHPAVGAVVCIDGSVVGEATTDPVDGHAIRAALVSAGPAARGAVLYTTLGPRRGDLALLSHLHRVVVGCPWPGMDPVDDVDPGCLDLVRGWLRVRAAGLPEVTVKVATSADGRIATQTGESQWITGSAAREVGHRLRGEHDAILVGVGTVNADDPRLTCRAPGVVGHPRPVILDTGLRIASDARVLHGPVPALVVCGPGAPERALTADVVRAPLDVHGRVDIEAALAACGAVGLCRVLVEGGAQVTRSLLDARLVDRVHQFIAGALLPGGTGWVGGQPVGGLDAIGRLRLERMMQIGDEGHLVWHADHRMPDEVRGSVT